jgi:hypothetical protein
MKNFQQSFPLEPRILSCLKAMNQIIRMGERSCVQMIRKGETRPEDTWATSLHSQLGHEYPWKLRIWHVFKLPIPVFMSSKKECNLFLIVEECDLLSLICNLERTVCVCQFIP